MSERRERYHRVYDRGYLRACEDLTIALRDFIAGGGNLAASAHGFDQVLAIRDKDRRAIVEVHLLTPQAFDFLARTAKAD